jgi:hypothetical protein
VGSLSHHSVCFVRAREIREGLLSTTTVDSQLIAFFTASIRLNELDLEDKGQPNCEFNIGERKKVVLKW